RDSDFTIGVSQIAFGELDGEAAVVVIGCEANRGSGRWTEGFVMRKQRGAWSGATKLVTRDRAHMGIENVEIEGRELIVTRTTTSEGAGSAEWTWTQHYKLAGGKLVEAGLGERVRQADSKPVRIEAWHGPEIARTTDTGDEYVLD